MCFLQSSSLSREPGANSLQAPALFHHIVYANIHFENQNLIYFKIELFFSSAMTASEYAPLIDYSGHHLVVVHIKYLVNYNYICLFYNPGFNCI